MRILCSCTCNYIIIFGDKLQSAHVHKHTVYPPFTYTVELLKFDTWVSPPPLPDILWHLTTIYGPKVFLLTKIKPEYSEILYNQTHFPGPFVCWIRQVPLYIFFTFPTYQYLHFFFLFISTYCQIYSKCSWTDAIKTVA